ncbi:MAG: hypothetical protein ACR2HA_06740 [Nocardioides sp.]
MTSIVLELTEQVGGVGVIGRISSEAERQIVFGRECDQVPLHD